MKINKQSRRGAKLLYRNCFAEGRLDESRVRDTVNWVVEKRPRGWLAILTQFERLVRLELDRRTARIESAAPLDDALQAQLKTRLEGIYGAGLSFQFVQSPELLGGLRIRVGSDVYDGSVESRLSALQESF